MRPLFDYAFDAPLDLDDFRLMTVGTFGLRSEAQLLESRRGMLACYCSAAAAKKGQPGLPANGMDLSAA